SHPKNEGSSGSAVLAGLEVSAGTAGFGEVAKAREGPWPRCV
ncbi:succinate dehydrogenase [ubiquinone] iron-sulfur protein, partial [Toxoplasma gondii VAND]